MDMGPMNRDLPAHAPWFPKDCDHLALILQGGGALGAYQAGAYQAMHEAGLEPDWVAGVSIGGINAAIIAGNSPENRLPRLRDFWNLITSRQMMDIQVDGDMPRRAVNALSALSTVFLGQPGFFAPNFPSPSFSLPGSKTATSYYDTSQLRNTLLKLVDFDLLNGGQTRFACGAVNVLTGNFQYFDNAETEILPEHVMASGALPPGLPWVQIGNDYYWDGGLVSNTPLIHLLTHIGSENVLVFQVDLFSSLGEIPRDMFDVAAREKEIRYSSRTRSVTDYYKKLHDRDVMLRALLEKMPEEKLSDAEKELKVQLGDIPQVTLLNLVYQRKSYERAARDFEFSHRSMQDHWAAGHLDAELTLQHKDWLTFSKGDVVAHDIHRSEDRSSPRTAALRDSIASATAA
jgi:NTE family protein